MPTVAACAMPRRLVEIARHFWPEVPAGSEAPCPSRCARHQSGRRRAPGHPWSSIVLRSARQHKAVSSSASEPSSPTPARPPTSPWRRGRPATRQQKSKTGPRLAQEMFGGPGEASWLWATSLAVARNARQTPACPIGSAVRKTNSMVGKRSVNAPGSTRRLDRFP